jgi:hypothetical protein
MYCRLLLIYTRCDWLWWMEERETARMRKYGESKTTRIMMATVPHVTSGSGLTNFRPMDFCSTECTKFGSQRFVHPCFTHRYESLSDFLCLYCSAYSKALEYYMLPTLAPDTNCVLSLGSNRKWAWDVEFKRHWLLRLRSFGMWRRAVCSIDPKYL